MGQTTGISWTDHTYNPWWGCSIQSEGCQFCYADDQAKRFGFNIWGQTADRRFFGEKHWAEPLKWNREAQKEGRQHWVFCASMADVFERGRHLSPQVQEQMAQARLWLWNIISNTPWLNWQLLTKRPDHIVEMVPLWLFDLPNVLFGTSVENQKRAEERIPQLLELRRYNPEVILFLSVEPQLEYVSLTPWFHEINWVIQGGESGPKHRPFDPDWARALRDECFNAGSSYWFKQHGGQTSHSGGCLLDGREWKEFPKMKGVLV